MQLSCMTKCTSLLEWSNRTFSRIRENFFFAILSISILYVGNTECGQLCKALLTIRLKEERRTSSTSAPQPSGMFFGYILYYFYVFSSYWGYNNMVYDGDDDIFFRLCLTETLMYSIRSSHKFAYIRIKRYTDRHSRLSVWVFNTHTYAVGIHVYCKYVPICPGSNKTLRLCKLNPLAAIYSKTHWYL